MMKKIKTKQNGIKNISIKAICTLMVCLGGLTISHAQNLGLVKDINPTALSQAGTIGGFIPFNTKTIFRADDGTHGNELWVTDGTEIGTALLKDINTTSFGPNNNSGVEICQIAVLNNQFYFGAYDGIHGTELWVSDGTTNGTFMLKDIITGETGSDARAFITFQNKVYFSAKAEAFVFENSLWATDGTVGGTVNIKNGFDILPQPNGTIGSILNGKLYFRAFDNAHGSELWTSDGTAAGTELVKDIFPGTQGGLGNKITVCNGLLYFMANDGTTGNELWSSDGTAAGTHLIKDIRPGPPSSAPYNFTAMNGLTYFAANDGPNFESNLYVTDGTNGGTYKVKQINTTSNGSAIGQIIAYDNKIYFSAFDGVHGVELWGSDGTANGTQLFADINPGAGTSSPQNLIVYNQKLLFMAASNGNNNALYETDHDINNLYIISSNPEPTPVLSPENSLSNGVLYFNCKTSGTDDAVYRYPELCQPGMPSTGVSLDGSLENNLDDCEQVILWTGNVSNNWFNKKNWLPKQVPTENDDIRIPADRPNYPVLASGIAKCKAMEIQTGGSLTMTAGTLNVYGVITATDASMFDLNGGNMVLYHGSVFPDFIDFYNLTLIALSNDLAENTYEFNEFSQVYGNLVLSGSPTGTADNVPFMKLAESQSLFLSRNLTINQGQIGMDPNMLPLTDNQNIPSVQFWGTTKQTVKLYNHIFTNIDPAASGFNCNVSIRNPEVVLTNTGRRIYCYNLGISSNLNLAGNRLAVLGKIIYQDYILTSYKISNTKPQQGQLSIFNFNEYSNDPYLQLLSVDKLRYFHYSGLTNDTLLLINPLVADTVLVSGYLDLLGENLTIGGVKKSTGYLECGLVTSTSAEGTVSLLGNINCPRYKLVAENINNITLNNPAGVELNNLSELSDTHSAYNRMNLLGTAKLKKGNFDMKQSSIYLSSNQYSNANAGRIIETPGNTFTNSANDNPPGAGFKIFKDTTVNTSSTDFNLGNLGFLITCSNPINDITIWRTPFTSSGLNGGNTINRFYTVFNQGAGTNLDAQIKLKYDDSELQGISESDLHIFRASSNEPTGVWHIVLSTVDTSTNIVSADTGLPQIDYSTGTGSATYYTLASFTSPPLMMDPSTTSPELNTANKVLVYPNPFSNNLNVQLEVEMAETATMQLIDINGKQIYAESVPLAEGYNDISLCNMEKLSAGIYFLRISSSKTNSVIKLIKD